MTPTPATRRPRWLLQATVRWGLQHGLVRLLLARAARAGDPQARLIMDRTTRLDPYPVHEQVREQGALARGRLTLVTASHAVSKELLHSRDFAVGAGDVASFPAARRLAAWAQDTRVLGPIDPPSLLAVEPPDHTRYRTLVAKVFTARAVQQLRPTVQSVAEALLDDVEQLPSGETFDLVERYARLLPVRVIARILGVPDSEHARLLALGEEVSPSVDLGLSWREHLRVQRGLHDFNAWLEGHLDHLRASPGDDLLSQLAVVEHGGARLDDIELRSTAGLLLAAGFETTVNLLGNGAKLLLEAPEQRELLQASPSRWPDAVEEVLRYDAPVQFTGRRALRGTRVAGVDVAEGEHVTTLLAAANRDPEVFADPHRFDVTRENAREHLSFSGGRHFCLGAALARVEGEVGLQALFDRFPGLVLAPGSQRRPTRVLRGWAHLPVRTGRPGG